MVRVSFQNFFEVKGANFSSYELSVCGMFAANFVVMKTDEATIGGLMSGDVTNIQIEVEHPILL